MGSGRDSVSHGVGSVTLVRKYYLNKDLSEGGEVISQGGVKGKNILIKVKVLKQECAWSTLARKGEQHGDEDRPLAGSHTALGLAGILLTLL